MKDIEQIALRLKNKIKGFTKLSIIGVGSELLGDDAVGLFIANKLKDSLKFPDIEILIGGTTPENLTGVLKRSKPSHILIIDAANKDEAPGEISVLDPDQIEGINFSTHTFSLSAMADYMMGEIGAKTVILGIQPEGLKMGTGLSSEVKHMADHAIEMLEEILSA